MKSTTMLATAFLIAQESRCVSYRVGAIISKHGRIVSTGYNGTVSGQPNCDEVAHENGWAEYVDTENIGKVLKLREDKSDDYSDWAKNEVIHAEMNAILYAAKTGEGIDGGSMYCTMAPCPECTKAIAQSGVKVLYYCEEYNGSDPSWADTLTQCGIKIHKIDKKFLPMIDFNKIKSKRERI